MSFDLKVINGDLVVQNSGLLRTVLDSEKLIQSILKICLTTAGSNPLNPGYGSFLSRTMVGNVLDPSIVIQMTKSQLNTCLTNLQSLQKAQIASMQPVSADEQLAAIKDITVLRSTTDPRLYSISITVISAGLKPITTAFNVSTI